jgi:hypothetical protein
MAGLVPAIHALACTPKTWMPGTRPGMTIRVWWLLPLPESLQQQISQMRDQDAVVRIDQRAGDDEGEFHHER